PYSIILSPKSTFIVIAILLLAFFGQAQTEPKPFITTWETKTENEIITIPTVSGETYNYTVNWGDGSVNTTHNNATPPSHSYNEPNTYTITISGTFPRIYLELISDGIAIASTAAKQIRSIEKWGDITWTSMNGAFRYCSNLTIDDGAGIPNLSNMKDMENMFSDVANLTGDISRWDVSSVTTMQFMFWKSSFNGNLSKWNVSSVTNMQGMFGFSSFNGDLGEWDISSVTDMSFMFFGNTSMSSENYDKLLIGWNTLDEAAGETRIPPDITFSAPNKYSCRGKAGRDALTGATHSWTIIGDELVPIRTDAAALQEVTSQCIASLTPSTAKSSCTMGEGTTITAAHDVSSFPITESTLVTWTFTHNSKSIVQTQTVTITEDTTDPIPGMDLETLTVDCGEITSGDDLNLRAPTATDNCDGSIMGTHNITDFPITSEITITWTFTDEAGNTSEQTQEVTIQDNTDPLPGMDLEALNVDCGEITSGDDLNLKAPTATDNCDGSIMGSHNITDFPITSEITITWTFTDQAGNTAEQTQTVTIQDNTDPMPGMDLEALNVDCGEITSGDDLNLKAPTATDNCDGSIMGSHNITDFPITSEITITWTFTDQAGNTAEQTQEVMITDCPSAPEENEPLGLGDDAVEAVVFPNPSGRYVEVQSPVESPVRILSVGGELVLESTTNTRIDAASLHSGLYLIQLPDGHLLKFVKK
ncbi:MAG: BspA family leucine-rich repeat surface protein, partial [Ekhidna sp.]|nr:BspA family leucine-rich repeat surface protein [Ekhidna sp.]